MRRFVPLTTLILLVPTSPASPAKPAAEADADAPILARERLTGQWWGIRDALEEGGVSIGGAYVAEFSSVFDGGINQRGSFRNLLTVDAELDLETMIDLDGASLFVQYLSVNPETGGSADAGDIQVYTNLESDRHLDTIYELWYEQQLFDDRLRIKVGKVDANSEFAFIDAAADFANSSAGFSPTIFVFPTYPDPATSLNVFARPIEGEVTLTLGYGLYDGAAGVDGVRTGSRGPATFLSSDSSDDYFHITEGALTWDSLGAHGNWLKEGRIALGAWAHSGDFDRFDGGVEEGTYGFHFTAEQRLWARGDRGLHAFVQYGWADQAVSDFAQHMGAGLVLRGTSDARSGDSAGLYATWADLSDEPAAGFDRDELAFDAYYRLELAPAVFVQPEIQYIVNPSGDPTIDNAIVGGLRVGVTF